MPSLSLSLSLSLTAFAFPVTKCFDTIGNIGYELYLGLLFPLVVHVSQEIHRGFQLTRGRFGGLFLKVKDAVSAKVTMEELKDFLNKYFPHMQSSLEDCKNMLDVFLAMRKECSLANFALLEIVVAHFDVPEARQHIDNYKKEFLIYEIALLSTEFASEMREEAQFRGSLSRCETIHLKMVWGKDETTLQEFEELIHYVFAPLARYVHLQAVLEGCIHCICYANRVLMGSLASRAKENLGGLRERGVIWLVVGEETLLDLRAEAHGKEVGTCSLFCGFPLTTG